MGKPITIVNKMAESVLTQETPECQQSNTGLALLFVAGQVTTARVNIGCTLRATPARCLIATYSWYRLGLTLPRAFGQ